MSHALLPRASRARLALPVLALVAVTALAGCGDEEVADPGGSAGSSSSGSPTPSGGGGGGQSSPADDGSTLDVSVAGEDLSPNAEEIELSPGDTLTVTVESDRSGELHVHSSPEQYVEFDEGTTTQELTFDAPGSVEIEEHESGAVVALVEVR